MDNCKFCDMLSNSSTFIKPENKTLYEDTNFIVVPALGSIVEGYLLLITKQHMNSMAELSLSNIINLLNVLTKIKETLYDLYHIVPIIFEHGSGNIQTENASSSIRHAHLHIVPINFCKTTHNTILNECNMHKFDITNQFIDYSNEPYILYIDKNNTPFISELENRKLPSQYMRRWIAKEIRNEDIWNWKEHPLLENINSTIKILNSSTFF